MTPSFYSETGVRERLVAALTKTGIRVVLAHVNREEVPIVAGIALGLILSLFVAS